MEELQLLQKKLVDIQKSGGGFKLSERSIVDIVQKIINRGKIKLVFTTNGKEYVAEEKIMKEITDEIKRNQGRISKLELVKSLEVPSNLIESKVSILISKDKSLNLIEGKIITNYYLENMCIEINEILKEAGNLLLSDLTTKFDLSIDFFKRFLQEKVGLSIKGKLYETRLLTDDYVNSQIQRIRPMLIASTTPIDITHYLSTYQIDELIVNDLIKKLIDSGMIKGKLTGNTFEPTIYAESQISYVKGVLNQNNYIEYIKLKSIGITKNPKEFIKEVYKNEPNGLFLKEYYITAQLKNNFEYVFMDNLSKGNSTNLSTIFLFELPEEDFVTLLENIHYKANQICYLNMNLVPRNLIDTFVDSITAKIKEEASKQYNTFVTKIKEKEKKKAEELKASEKDQKKKTKSNKQKKNKFDKDDDEDTADNYITLTPKFKNELELLFYKSPCFEDLNDKQETVTQLFEKFALLKINQLYSQFIHEFIKSKSQNTNDPRNMMNQIENEFFELRFIQKSLEALTKISNEANNQSAIKAITAHICKKDLTNLLKNVLTYQLIHMKSKIDLNKLNDPNQRKEIINSTFSDDDLKEIFTSLNENLQNKNFISFMNTLQDNSKYLAISLTQLDKKKEKIIIEKYKGEVNKFIDEKLARLGNLNKKDYIALLVDLCHNSLLNKGFFLKLPYELWAIGLFSNLIPEMKEVLISLNDILNLGDDDFSSQSNELENLINKLLNTY